MGWTFGYRGRNDASESEAPSAWSGDRFSARRVARKFVGNTLYALVEVLHDDGTRERYIQVVLL